MKVGKASYNTGDNEEKMPFGKHKDEEITEISDHYLEWVLEQDWAIERYPILLEAIGNELTTREEQGNHIDQAGNHEANDLPWEDFGFGPIRLNDEDFE